MPHAFVDSPIGRLKITECCGKITQISETYSTGEIDSADISALLQSAKDQIESYFRGELTVFNFPFSLVGSEFQVSVWEQARRIPYGSSCTYSDIARAIGRPRAVRAVGNALGANPLLLVIPCHRVTACSGLGGFRLGLQSKSFLLSLENSK